VITSWLITAASLMSVWNEPLNKWVSLHSPKTAMRRSIVLLT
jgi:hypothetical protein